MARTADDAAAAAAAQPTEERGARKIVIINTGCMSQKGLHAASCAASKLFCGFEAPGSLALRREALLWVREKERKARQSTSSEKEKGLAGVSVRCCARSRSGANAPPLSSSCSFFWCLNTHPSTQHHTPEGTVIVDLQSASSISLAARFPHILSL
jgi:hypothetical protein